MVSSVGAVGSSESKPVGVFMVVDPNPPSDAASGTEPPWLAG